MTNQIFSWKQAILQNDELPTTTRHLLLTLSCYMNSMGESCYPSIETLMKVTKLSNRAIITHIEIAIQHGFLRRELHGFKGQKWKRNEYIALMPEQKLHSNSAKSQEGSEQASPPLGGKGSEPSSPALQEGSERRYKKAVNVVHTNKPLNLTNLSGSNVYIDKCENDFLENPPPPVFEHNDFDVDNHCFENLSSFEKSNDFEIRINQDLESYEIEEEEEQEEVAICPKRKLAFEFIALHYELDNKYFYQRIVPEPYAFEDVQRALSWVEAGVERKFVSNLMNDRLHKRKLKGRGAVVNFKMWDDFMIREYKAAVASGDYVPQSAKQDGSSGSTSKPPLDVANVNIKITNQRLQKSLEHFPPAEQVECCRRQMLKLRNSPWWFAAMQAMERKFGKAVRAAWFDQICPVLGAFPNDETVLVIYAETAFMAARINEQYGRHLFEALHRAGLAVTKIEFTH